MTKQTFNWGDTPTIIVGRVDHFLAAPCWFDEVGADDIHPTVYDSINLNDEYRTNRLKCYYAHDALFRGSWLDQNISSTTGHLTLAKGSELWVVDGYPKQFLDCIVDRFDIVYERLFSKPPGKPFKNKIKSHQVKTAQHFSNQVSAAEALAKNTGIQTFILGKQSFTEQLPELNAYHNALRQHQQLRQEELRQAYATMSDETITSEPMTQEEIDALLKKYDDDDDGGTIQ